MTPNAHILGEMPADDASASESANSGTHSPLDRSFLIAAIVTFVLAVLAAVIWPGDAPFRWDEPKLLSVAYDFNAHHAWSNSGLNGNFSVPYGPLGTQIYQVLLAISHDLRVISFLHALVMSLLMAGALLWTARSLNLTPWFATAILLAPFLVWCERDLWDATYALPLGCVGVASYAACLRNRSAVLFMLTVVCISLVPLVHPQGLPLFVAIVAHVCLRQRGLIWRYWWIVGLAAALLVWVNSGYLQVVQDRIEWLMSQKPKHAGIPTYQGRSNLSALLESLSAPFYGGDNFTGDNAIVPRTKMPGPPDLVFKAIRLAYIIIYLIWLGIAVTVVQSIRLLGRKRVEDAAGATGANAQAARYEIMLVCVGTLFLQLVLMAILRVPAQPQYSFGTYPAHILFAWFAIDFLRHIRLSHILTAIYGISVAYLTFGGEWAIHRYGWPKLVQLPTINNVMELAHQINQYQDPRVYADVDSYTVQPAGQLNPLGAMILSMARLLDPQTPAPTQVSRTGSIPTTDPTTKPAHTGPRLLIRFRNRDITGDNLDGHDSRAEIVELGEGPLPDDAKEIETQLDPHPPWF